MPSVVLGWGWQGCCWLGDTPVVTPAELELPPWLWWVPLTLSCCRVLPDHYC